MINREQIIKTALQTIDIEVNTLLVLKENINEQFVEIVEKILNSNGRLVVTGVGKSALIGQKIVATFNSTGTPAMYMHAADAVHGDLGMITKEDIILCLSKSGETAEIKVLIPILKNFGNTLIGMTAQTDSYLSKHADFVLIMPVGREADPNKLAPTASSMAQMALGDALASALLSIRGFSDRQFAKFHPGGSLGKQLYLRVKNIYPENEKPQVFEDSSIKDVIIEMTSKRLGVAVVCDRNKSIVGVITDGDIRRMLEKYQDISAVKAMDIMCSAPKMIEENELAIDAFRIMRENSITQIIVADDNKYLGVVHIHDLINQGMV